jgi:two-component system chemotaxis response regulator CheV
MDIMQNEVDERTNLTGTNKFEMLLFKLGNHGAKEFSELFGINVFKIREIVAMPQITKIAGSNKNILGVVNLRGQVISVIDLPATAGYTPKNGLNILLITEFSGSTQAFAVESVEDIVRLNWSDVLSTDSLVTNGMVTSIARFDDAEGTTNLVMVLDIETILRGLFKKDSTLSNDGIIKNKIKIKDGSIIIAADDSVVARELIESGLNSMGLPFVMTKTGKEAWNKLESIAKEAELGGYNIEDRVALILTDLEMPEMDGFTLTRQIKKDKRFQKIPVVIHSSLTGASNEEHVKSVGADAYVAKFVQEELEKTLMRVLKV